MRTPNEHRTTSHEAVKHPAAGAGKVWAAAALYGSGLYLAAVTAWLLAGRSFPMGTSDPAQAGLWSGGLPWPAAAAVMSALAVASCIIAGRILLQGRKGVAAESSGAYRVAAAFAVLLLCVSLLLVADHRMLMILGYLPMLLFGWFHEPFRNAVQDFNWVPVIHQFVLLAASVLWVRLAFTLRMAAKPYAGPPFAAAAKKWGKAASWTAVAIPLVYASTRLLWAAGVPFGITEDFLAELEASQATAAELTLGGMAAGGAVLTMGLVQRWGERFPAWMPGLAGKPVPVKLAVIPATLMSLAVFSAGIPALTGGIRGLSDGDVGLAENFLGAAVPTLLWIPWALALGLATYAYFLRRTTSPRRGIGTTDGRT